MLYNCLRKALGINRFMKTQSINYFTYWSAIVWRLFYPYRQQAKKRWGGSVTHHFLEFILNSMTLQGQINHADDQFWLLLWLLLNTFSSKIENTRGPTCIVSPNTANSIAPHVMQVQRLGPLCYVLNFERFKRGIANLVRYSLKYRASANIKTIINFIQYLVRTYIKKCSLHSYI